MTDRHQTPDWAFLTTTNEDERSGFFFFSFVFLCSLLLLFYCEGAWARFTARAGTGGVPWVAFARSLILFSPRLLLLTVLFIRVDGLESSQRRHCQYLSPPPSHRYHYYHTVASPGRYMSLPNTNIPPADSARNRCIQYGFSQLGQKTCFQHASTHLRDPYLLPKGTTGCSMSDNPPVPHNKPPLVEETSPSDVVGRMLAFHLAPSGEDACSTYSFQVPIGKASRTPIDDATTTTSSDWMSLVF